MAGSPRRIELVAVGPLPTQQALFQWLGGQLSERFGAPAGAGEPLEIREEWRDAASGQVDSNHVVDAMIARDEPLDAHATPHRWQLGITEADLFAPGRSFVFGEAAQGGAWAVISLARLRADLGSVDPESLLTRRTLKEAVHELGHLAGLEHCSRPECVMFPSRDLRDTDRKSTRFCPACEVALRGSSGVDRSLDQR